MKLNKIKEVGFYRAINDTKPNYIYEVINNTDEEWLKDVPEQKFLIDEWIFDYIDKDDRFHYGCAGNLVAVQNSDDIEVVKITDTKYKVEGNCGEYLVEDKLTYKEKCIKLQEALEQIRDIAKCSKEPMNCDNCPICNECEELCVNEENLQCILINKINGVLDNADK